MDVDGKRGAIYAHLACDGEHWTRSRRLAMVISLSARFERELLFRRHLVELETKQPGTGRRRRPL